MDKLHKILIASGICLALVFTFFVAMHAYCIHEMTCEMQTFNRQMQQMTEQLGQTNNRLDESSKAMAEASKKMEGVESAIRKIKVSVF